MQSEPEASTQPRTHEQVVLILVGLIGSGKSTFAQALERFVPRFRRCNQDELGDRRSVEALARRSLREGLSICIDRSNFDESQRATWINIARECPGTTVWVLVLDTPSEICAARIRERTDHPTITDPDQGLSILRRFQSQYRLPAPHEGHSRVLYLRPADTPEVYTEADITGILDRIRDSPMVNSRDRGGQFQPHFGSPNGGAYGGAWRGGGYRARGGVSSGYRPYNDGSRWGPPSRGRGGGYRGSGSGYGPSAPRYYGTDNTPDNWRS